MKLLEASKPTAAVAHDCTDDITAEHIQGIIETNYLHGLADILHTMGYGYGMQPEPPRQYVYKKTGRGKEQKLTAVTTKAWERYQVWLSGQYPYPDAEYSWSVVTDPEAIRELNTLASDGYDFEDHRRRPGTQAWEERGDLLNPDNLPTQDWQARRARAADTGVWSRTAKIRGIDKP